MRPQVTPSPPAICGLAKSVRSPAARRRSAPRPQKCRRLWLLKAYNDAGGFHGKKVHVKVYDDEGKGEEAAATITKLITQDHVLAVLGEVASTRSIAMAPIAQNYRVPMVTPSSTNPKVTEIGDYIFRVCFIDPFQGTVMAKFAANDLHAKNCGHSCAIRAATIPWGCRRSSSRRSRNSAAPWSKTRPIRRTTCTSNRS